MLGPATRFRLTYRHQEEIWAYLFLAPTLIGLFAFTLGPAVASIVLAFFSSNFITDTHWVGFGNFEDMLGDSTFWRSVQNTLVYAIGHIIPTVLLSMGLAIALNQSIRGRSFFRTLYFLPIVAPVVATSLVWAWAYHSEFGIFNYFVRLLGFNAIPWLTDSSFALPSVIIWSVWAGLGYSVILFLAALQNVPREQIEASKLDGATAWQTFRFITFPAVSPTTFFVIVLQIIGSFQVFTEVYVMTQGGPGYATYTVIYYLFLSGWNTFRFGYASAVAVFLFVVLAAITYIQFRVQRTWVHYEHE